MTLSTEGQSVTFTLGGDIATGEEGNILYKGMHTFLSSNLSYFIMKIEWLGELGWVWDLRKASLGSKRKRYNYKHNLLWILRLQAFLSS